MKCKIVDNHNSFSNRWIFYEIHFKYFITSGAFRSAHPTVMFSFNSDKTSHASKQASELEKKTHHAHTKPYLENCERSHKKSAQIANINRNKNIR